LHSKWANYSGKLDYVEARNDKFRFQKFWCRPKHPYRHAHFFVQGCRKVQIVSSLDK
jgi:hypothetical protein